MNAAQTATSLPDTIDIYLTDLKSDLTVLLESNRENLSFEETEKQLHAAFIEVEKKVIRDLMSQYDIDVPLFYMDGEKYRRVIRSNNTYMSCAGSVQLQRSLYRANGQKETICPMELGAGIIESHWTPKAAKQALHLVSQLTPYEAEKVFCELGGMNPSKSSLDRLPKKLGRQWEANKEGLELTLREMQKIPAEAVALAVSLDGVLIPMQGGRILPGDSRYEEASCGTVTYYNESGEPLLTRRHGCMPEHKKKTMKSFLKAEVDYALEQQPALRLVKVADGAKDNWRFLDEALPKGVSVLDFYHAAEHLKSAFDLVYAKDDIKSRVEFNRYHSLLRHDPKGIDKVIKVLARLVKKYPAKKLLLTELNYFKNNKERCRYYSIAENNLPIGSGIVEATCKTLVTQRLKRSGMCWGMEGGQSILTFRSLLQSKLFDPAWAELSEKYKTKIRLPDNVVLLEGYREKIVRA